MIWDHPFVKTLVTEQRAAEFQSEFAYTVLAKEMVETMEKEPEFAHLGPVVQDFLARTFTGYSNIPSIDITNEDLEDLRALNDEQLRPAIASILVGADPVEANREARKPHSSAEIADMEVLINHESEIFHLSMPFKSGQEIGGNSVPVKWFYQILRSHMFFTGGIVVFISAKPCSQLLMNYIKQARDRQGWPYGVIDDRDLAALLKLNGKLKHRPTDAEAEIT